MVGPLGVVFGKPTHPGILQLGDLCEYLRPFINEHEMGVAIALTSDYANRRRSTRQSHARHGSSFMAFVKTCEDHAEAALARRGVADTISNDVLQRLPMLSCACDKTLMMWSIPQQEGRDSIAFCRAGSGGVADGLLSLSGQGRCCHNIDRKHGDACGVKPSIDVVRWRRRKGVG